jgi:hypothetical protein
MKNDNEIKVEPQAGKSWRNWRKMAPILGMIGLLLAFLVTTIFLWRRQATRMGDPPARSGAGEAAKPANAYGAAVRKVEEERGEAVGNKAKINVPPELKLYKDRNRFLAIQVAESLEQKYEIPRDFAELAPAIGRNDFERLPNLGENYILYGVGLRADDELTHFDEKTGKSIPLLAGEAELDAELKSMDESLKESDGKAKTLKQELSKLPRADKQAAREMQKQIAAAQKSTDAVKKRRELITSFYKSEDNKRLMFEEYGKLAGLASRFDNRSYDLNDATGRKQFKIGLLSMLRPGARAQLEEIAASYRQKFERPLPITSLLRTREYQRVLGESGNPNAIAIDIPPHTTGLAFDIYTYYMTAGEQQFLLDEIARLERDGRLEALRENRDHIHVFAFADGKRPSEALIKEAFKFSKRK